MRNFFLVLDPKGPVATEELRLIILSAVLVFAVILPVLALFAFVVWRYRDRPDNRAPYRPEWSESKTLETIWWSIPIVIVGVLSVYTAKTVFAVQKPPQKSADPLTVEVMSLDWKWLFEYPGQGVATVNYAVIPTGVPVQFELTSDAPMNSFWIPQLGGQEYTMPGMAMRLWLQADNPGRYYGHGANFTGSGFAHDQFWVQAVPQARFAAWATRLSHTAPALTDAAYSVLKKPGLVGTRSYASFPPGLFDATIWADGGRYMKNMLPGPGSNVVPGTGMTMNSAGAAIGRGN